MNKRGVCVKQTLHCSQLNIHYKRFKFDLILNKSVRLQFQEEVKDIILKSLCLNVTLKIPWFIIFTAALHSSLSIEEKNNPFAN